MAAKTHTTNLSRRQFGGAVIIAAMVNGPAKASNDPVVALVDRYHDMSRHYPSDEAQSDAYADAQEAVYGGIEELR